GPPHGPGPVRLSRQGGRGWRAGAAAVHVLAAGRGHLEHPDARAGRLATGPPPPRGHRRRPAAGGAQRLLRAPPPGPEPGGRLRRSPGEAGPPPGPPRAVATASLDRRPGADQDVVNVPLIAVYRLRGGDLQPGEDRVCDLTRVPSFLWYSPTWTGLFGVGI